MEKVTIQISPEVVDYLNKLVGVLFEKQYFNFQEFAHQYVNQIYDFIEFDLINFPQKETPPDLRHLGAFYTFLMRISIQHGICFMKNGNVKF